LVAAIVDLDLHVLEDAGDLDVDAFEKKTLGKIGAPAEIGMRHRIPHFQHIIGGYASGYYSYMWSEVMDADAFSAFEEAGDIFDPELAAKLHDHIYSAGGRRDPAKLYKAFRGRQPKVQELLEKRGLAGACPPVIPEAEPQARLSGTSRNESNPRTSDSFAEIPAHRLFGHCSPSAGIAQWAPWPG